MRSIIEKLPPADQMRIKAIYVAALNDIRVFPCKSDKTPSLYGGYKNAARTEAHVAALFREAGNRAQLIGVATGDLSGIGVLDIDPKNGGMSWYEAHKDRLPITELHHTRGGGLHLIFRHWPGMRSSASKIAPGVDIRADGGHVIWWPAHRCAVENAGIVAEWPSFLLDIIDDTAKKSSDFTYFPPTSDAEAKTRAHQMIAKVVNDLRAAAPGERHYRLRTAGIVIGGLLHIIMPEESAQKSKKTAFSVKMLLDLLPRTSDIDFKKAGETAEWSVTEGMKRPLLTR